MALFDLSLLSADTRQLIQDAPYRVRLTSTLLRADAASPEAAEARDAIDSAVVEILAAAGLPRGPITGPIVERYNRGWFGRKLADCHLLVDTGAFELLPADGRSDSLLRTWIHESLHARQPYTAMYSQEWREAAGYEEGVAEGLTHVVAVEGLGLRPLISNYRSYVAAYRSLAIALDIDVERLWRVLWGLPAGGVRSGFLPAIERLLSAYTPRRLSAVQRTRLSILAARYFGTDRMADQPNEPGMILIWRRMIG